MSSAKKLIIDAAVLNRDTLENYFQSYTHYIENHTAWLIRQKLKKLRSIFQLLEPHLKTGKKFKSAFALVFDTLGNYRDAQQMFIYAENHLTHDTPDNLIMQILKKEIEESHKKLSELLKSPVPSELIRRLDIYILKIKSLPRKSVEKLEQSYLKRRYNNILRSIKKEQELENMTLHKCRILLKQIINLMKITDIKFGYKKISLKLKELEQIDKELGTWHDLVVLLSHFKALQNTFNEPKQKEQFHAFIRSVEDEERRYYQSALDALGLMG